MVEKKKILDYLENEWRSFEDFPFNEVDYAVFCLLSYFDFSAFLPLYGDSIALGEMYDLSKKDRFLKRIAYTDNDFRLFVLVTGNPRFRFVRALRYEHFSFPTYEEQFAAVSFYLPDGKEVIAFRGTDSSLLGWKEDFLLATEKPLASQIDARKYFLNELHFSNKPLIIVGHSKGGNLASFVYFSATQEERKRIFAVYSFDSPGFSKEMKENLGLVGIKENYYHLIPFESIFGELYKDNGFSTVINSDGRYFEQHSLYSWLVDDGSFIRTSITNPRLKKMMQAFNEWADRTSLENRHYLIETIFTLLISANIKNTKEIMDAKFDSFLKIRKEYKKLLPEEKNKLCSIGKDLFSLLKKSFFHE